MLQPGGRLRYILPTSAAALAVAIIISLLRCQPSVEGFPYAYAMRLASVGIASSGEGWAVGTISGAPTGLMMHYQGGHWTIMPSLAGLCVRASLYRVVMVSASEGWALRTPRSRSPRVPLTDCAAGATSFPAAGDRGMLVHFAGGRWDVVPTPTNVPLLSIAMVSPQEGRAVGPVGTILHYHAGDGAH